MRLEEYVEEVEASLNRRMRAPGRTYRVLGKHVSAVEALRKRGVPPSVVAGILAHEFSGKGLSETLYVAGTKMTKTRRPTMRRAKDRCLPCDLADLARPRANLVALVVDVDTGRALRPATSGEMVRFQRAPGGVFLEGGRRLSVSFQPRGYGASSAAAAKAKRVGRPLLMPDYQLAKCVSKKVLLGQAQKRAVQMCDSEWSILSGVGHRVRAEVKSPRKSDRAGTGSPMSGPTYTDFVLMLQPISKHPKSVWYHSRIPVPWTEARDRIVASGATRGFVAGGYGEGRYMLSVDSHEIALWKRSGRKARPLPRAKKDRSFAGAIGSAFKAVLRAADPTSTPPKRFNSDSIRSRLWIKGAVKHRGKLRALLNVPPGQVIPSWVKEQGCQNPRRTFARVLKRIPSAEEAREFQRMACLARTLAGLGRGAKVRKVATRTGTRRVA